jgi:hypothetical protein
VDRLRHPPDHLIHHLTAPVTHRDLGLQKHQLSSANPVRQDGTQKIFGSRLCSNRL